MKIYTTEELDEIIAHLNETEPERDNQGQLVFYTGVFEWDDGSFRDTPER